MQLLWWSKHTHIWISVMICITCTCSCSPRNESLGQCYHYIQQGSIYFNKSSPHTPDAVDLYFHRLDTQSPPMCAEKLKRLLCWSIYPLCGPKGQLPLCKESCDVAAEGPCALNSTMRSLLLSNCGGPMPLAGDLPECLQLPSGKLSGM